MEKKEYKKLALENEDCLYLNIYVPFKQNEGKSDQKKNEIKEKHIKLVFRQKIASCCIVYSRRQFWKRKRKFIQWNWTGCIGKRCCGYF